LQGVSEDIVRLVNQGAVLKNNLIDLPQINHAVLNNGKSAAKSYTYKSLTYSQSYLEGMTFFELSNPAMKLVGKSGMFPGFSSWFLYDPETSTAIAVFINQEGKCMDAMLLAVNILRTQRNLIKERTHN